MSDTASEQAEPGDLSDDIVDAILSAAKETELREPWLPEPRGVSLHLVPRLVMLAGSVVRNMPEDSTPRRMVRQNFIRIMAYTKPDVRLAMLLDLASRDPAVLRDILGGTIDEDYDRYRYNIMTSLGTFARHGLLKTVFTRDRLDRTSRALGRSREMLGSRFKEERRS